MLKIIIAAFITCLPQILKRYLYIKFYGYQIHKTSRIGFSLLMPRQLVMHKNTRIGHLNVIKGLTTVFMAEAASIGNLNWVSGFPENIKTDHFADQRLRSPRLTIGEHSAITNRHLIDCTDTVSIGKFSTFAGFRSQILTHSISITESRQLCGPVYIGDYTFVGTSSIILLNSVLPNYSVLGAGATLNKKYTEEYQLYVGNPARPVKNLDQRSAYFNRKTGYVI